MTHERFEYKAISMLLKGNDPIFDGLFKQFLSAEVLKREEVETGFIVHFKVPKYLAVEEITKQISGVRVMLAKEEVLSLELIVLEGIIAQLNATYTSEIKSLDLIYKSNDLTFAYATNTVSKLKTELDQNSELLKKAEQLLSENIQISELLAENQGKKSELVKNFEELFSENSRTRELLVQEQIRNAELAEEIAELLAERTKINDLLEQGQDQNLKLAEEASKLRKSLEYYNFEPVEPKEEEPEYEEPLIENQREKLSPVFERITDNFLNKIFDKKEDIEEYRRKTKYHIAVWRLAFTLGINTLFYLFFTVALIIILLFGVQNILGDSSHIMGFSALRIASGSMEPELPVNSLIVIRQDDPNNFKAGQVATYLREDGLSITHRIYHLEKDEYGNNVGFILRGDANLRPNNQIVPSENMLGRVVFSSYVIGRILLFFETRFMLVIVITLTLLIVLYIGKRRVVKRLRAQPGKGAD